MEGFSYTLYYLAIFRLEMGGNKEGEDLLGIQPLCSILPVSTVKRAVKQEPKHTSTCKIAPMIALPSNSSPSFSPPLTYDCPHRTKFMQGSYYEGTGRGIASREEDVGARVLLDVAVRLNIKCSPFQIMAVLS